MAEIGNQGPYNPSGFNAANPATWPRPIGGGPYFAGQFWTASAAGTIDVPVVAGDRVYVSSTGRDYGEFTYGDAYYGWNSAGPWADAEVEFRAWSPTGPPWDRPAPPFSGCPFDDERYPGWRVVVESLQIDDGSPIRTYGSLNYGDQVYGDGVPGWLSGVNGSVTTPDTADLFFAGPVRMTAVVDVEPGGTAERVIASQRASGASGLAWQLFFPGATTAMRFSRSVNGTTWGNVAMGAIPDSAAVRTITLDWNPAASVGSFFATLDGEPIGTQHDVTAGLFNSTNLVSIGNRYGTAPFRGRIYSFTIESLDAVNGNPTAVILRFDASEVPASVATAGGTWTDPRGRVWTIPAGAITPFAPYSSSTTTLQWADITRTNFSVVIRRGNSDGNPVVAVDQCLLDFRDLDADLFRFAQPESWFAPRVGTRIRVGVLAPSLAYTSLFVGRIEQITDEHDTPPRLVQVDAYGSAFDLVSDELQWQRGAETATVRTAAIIAASGYVWAPAISDPPASSLLADPAARDIVLRQELDRTAMSVGYMFDTTPNGSLRFRPWPDVGVGPIIETVDCRPGLIASPVLITGDLDEVVNTAKVSNVNRVVRSAQDDGSITYFGRRTEGLGMPFADLATPDAGLQALADAAVATYSRTSNRIESLDVDIVTDTAWFEILVGLDLGRRVRFTRRAFPDHPLTIDAVVCGYEHRLVAGSGSTPGRWNTTLNTTTRTRSI